MEEVSARDPNSSSQSQELTNEQKLRIARNKQKAIQIRQSKIAAVAGKSSFSNYDGPVIHIANKRVIDSGAGFFLEEETVPDDEPQPKTQRVSSEPVAYLFPDDRQHCETCKIELIDSYLLKHFDLLVCDNCRDSEDAHSLITKTEARDEYLLKDCDFDKREPVLRFISKKNPHRETWGEMKLYLKCQVEARCIEVWGSIENLEEEKEKRQAKRVKTKQKKFDKQVKELRMTVRSSLYNKVKTAHQHEYGEEVYDSANDEYSKTCKTCDHVLTYEKL